MTPVEVIFNTDSDEFYFECLSVEGAIKEICTLINEEVVIQWENSQEELDDLLQELGLERGAIVVNHNRECSVIPKLCTVESLFTINYAFCDYSHVNWKFAIGVSDNNEQNDK